MASTEATASCTGDAAPSICARSADDPLINRWGEAVPALRTFYLYLTAGCNLACRHCWISPRYQANGGTGGHLDLAALERAIVAARPLGLISVKLTGGEPTLHPEFHALCQLLARHGLKFWMETNAVLLREPEAKLLAELGRPFVSVSLDGATAKTHDHQRAVPGAFDAALEGIRCLVAEGIHPQVIFTLTRDNEHELFDAFRLARSIGCSSVKINLLEPTGRGHLMTVGKRGFTTPELLDIGARVEAYEPELGLPLHYSWPPAFWGLKRVLRGDVNTCGIHGILGVLADGTLAMCGIGRHIEELVYGKLDASDIAEVWLNHPKLRELRSIAPADFDGVCGQCLHASTCFGACRANTYTSTPSLRAPYKLCQDAFELGRFPATRLRPRGVEG